MHRLQLHSHGGGDRAAGSGGRGGRVPGRMRPARATIASVARTCARPSPDRSGWRQRPEGAPWIASRPTWRGRTTGWTPSWRGVLESWKEVGRDGLRALCRFPSRACAPHPDRGGAGLSLLRPAVGHERRSDSGDARGASGHRAGPRADGHIPRGWGPRRVPGRRWGAPGGARGAQRKGGAGPVSHDGPNALRGRTSGLRRAAEEGVEAHACPSREALRRNPALLKLDLYCKGARLDESCFIEQDGGRKVLRTRAGLGSGLEAILPGGLWTNIPVTEAFAQTSPYTIRREGDAYLLRHHEAAVAPLTLSPRPAWYEASTSTGKPMTRIGTLQGTYLGIYQAKVCEYWTAKPQKTNCKFCSVGLNLGVDDADEKSVSEVMEVVRRAAGRIGHHLRRLQYGALRRRHLPGHPRALPRAHQEGARPSRRVPDTSSS